jgi:hypothetical protein
MTDKRSRARRFVADVKAGLSDEALRVKYGLSAQKFFFYKATALDIIAKEREQQAREKRKIDAKQFLSDMDAGMDNEALMIRYGLAARDLQSVFRQIIAEGLATPLQLSNRLSITRSQVTEAFVQLGRAVRELD